MIENTISGRVLVMENERIDFEPFHEAFEAKNFVCEYAEDGEHFMDKARSLIPEIASHEVPILFSLDLKLQAPNIFRGTLPENGGAWIYREFLQAGVEGNDFIKAEQVKVLREVPVCFVTNHKTDHALETLEREAKQNGNFLPVFSKDEVEPCMSWAVSVAAQLREIAEVGASSRRYSDAGLTVTRLCELLQLDNTQIVRILTAGRDPLSIPIGENTDNIWSEVLNRFPAKNAVAPSADADRWEIIARILADTIAVFDDDDVVARRDLSSKRSIFNGRSILDILESPSLSDLSEVHKHHDKRWGH